MLSFSLSTTVLALLSLSASFVEAQQANNGAAANAVTVSSSH